MKFDLTHGKILLTVYDQVLAVPKFTLERVKELQMVKK